MNQLTGKINLSKELQDLAFGTPIIRSGGMEVITGEATLLPYAQPVIENVWLTLEATLDQKSVASFLDQGSYSAFSAFMCRFLGEACDKGTSIILTYAQNDELDVPMFIALNPSFDIQWFTILSEEDFKTYLIELKKFSETTQQVQKLCLN